MRPQSLLVVSALVLFAFACGSPKAGDQCDTTGFLCESNAAALECKVGAWVALPCRGLGGCKRQGNTVTCDMSANVEGDACASTAEGKGLCTTDGLGTLECRDGRLVKTNTCRTCTVVGDQVICQP
jgi:hypothetical protein